MLIVHFGLEVQIPLLHHLLIVNDFCLFADDGQGSSSSFAFAKMTILTIIGHGEWCQSKLMVHNYRHLFL